MTPEQLKLLQQLAQIGEVSLIKKSKASIIKAIETMNLDSLNSLLDDNLTYQDLTKDVFLEKLSELFIELKEQDSHLVANKGFCSSVECSNNSKKGVAFFGNNSGKHFNFIFEQDDKGLVTELFHCNKFQCESENVVQENKKELFIKIHDDVKANFTPYSDYSYKNNYALNALSELASDKKLEITDDELIYWLDKHKEFYESLDWISNKYKNLSKFYDCYSHIDKINDFFNLEDACFDAYKVYSKNDMSIEMQLLKWLVEHEELRHNLMLLHPNVINEKDLKSGKVNLFSNLNRYFNSDNLKYCIAVENIFDTLYYDKLNHYQIEDEKLKNITPFDDEFDNNSSLKYHLEKRNLFVDKFNYIPLLKKNSFLYDAPDFTMMENGVNLDSQSFNRDISLYDKRNDDFEIL
jgi:hypothetical protein